MKELYGFEKMLSEMTSSLGGNVVYSNDFGMERSLQNQDPITGKSYLESAFSQAMAALAAHGKTESQAKKIIDKTVKELIGQNDLPPMPEEKDSDGKKAMWVSEASSKVMAYLRLTGEIFF